MLAIIKTVYVRTVQEIRGNRITRYKFNTVVNMHFFRFSAQQSTSAFTKASERSRVHPCSCECKNNKFRNSSILFINKLKVVGKFNVISLIMPPPSVTGRVYYFPRRQLIFSFDRRVLYHLKGLRIHSACLYHNLQTNNGTLFLY